MAEESRVADAAAGRPRNTDVTLSVVVPAYNEEARLRPTLDAIRAHLAADPGRWGVWELIVVDDGSSDGTVAIAEAAAAEEPRVRLVRSPGNHGKGHALRLGVLASYGRRVLLTDADLATPIEELDQLDKRLGEQAADDGLGAAIGSRAHPDARIEVRQWALREWLGRLGNRLIQAVAVDGIEDTQCGFKLFDGDQARAAFGASRLDGWGIDVEILRYFRRAGWPVTEVPVRWAHQPGSKVRPLDYVRVLLELVRLKAGRSRSARWARWASGSRPSGSEAPNPGTSGPGTSGLRPVDLTVTVLFVLAALFLYKGLWSDLDHSYLADSGSDQNQWEWFFAVTADNVRHLHNPLFTTFQNFPDGVNLMANTVMLGLSVPLTPVTLLFGPTVTWAFVLTFGLAATATAWYWLFARRLTRNRWAAALGAALAAFAPPMMSHANAHPNFLVLFMIPVIIDRALRLCDAAAAAGAAPGEAGPGDAVAAGAAPKRVARDGVLLGLFVTYQIFLGEEPLLLAVMGMLLFALAYAFQRRDVAKASVRPLLRGLGYALQVCLPLLAFPLYWQFFGPQSYHSVLHGDNAGNSPLSFLHFSGRALFGTEAAADPLAMNRTEQNAFYGWPLIALSGGLVVWLWRLAAVRALAFTAAAAALLSLGPRVRIPFTDVVLPGPWRVLAHQPLFESVIESRVAMICAPALGALVALAADRLGDEGVLPRRSDRLVGLAALATALIPIIPTPMPVRERPDVPAFIADGTYRSYVSPGESVVPVPLPDPGDAEALHWQSASGLGFSVPGGYFNGPWGPDRRGIYGASPRFTSNWLREVRNTGQVPPIGPGQQAQARFDLAFWKAGVVVLAPQPNDAALYETVEKLLGEPGKRVDGAWIWDLPPTGAGARAAGAAG
ncbi:dolichyl-phosphate beta-glucosyltransferase [Streptomyces liangshanensis]|uniref:dolichyl-phosphate beta-glucosyltransferase n=1 Tax=Streptomyces liangshanensis TaxID=2717324 RepID=A0A6G9H9N6_9ACTN|nr:dolichyl-phosphate beta-glucosyltransferase [Streptomyces liangshanensis]QIQ06921.1 glycosyltransferase family 2 protein [Streptomyces liangshanensis]